MRFMDRKYRKWCKQVRMYLYYAGLKQRDIKDMDWRNFYISGVSSYHTACHAVNEYNRRNHHA